MRCERRIGLRLVDTNRKSIAIQHRDDTGGLSLAVLEIQIRLLARNEAQGRLELDVRVADSVRKGRRSDDDRVRQRRAGIIPGARTVARRGRVANAVGRDYENVIA